jgi:hypothetical protein
MRNDPKQDKKSRSNNRSIGLRVMFSEKAFTALLHIILALSISQVQFQNSANQEIPAKEFREQSHCWLNDKSFCSPISPH